ncbi:1-acyl-sn-glycerol-3-phosphate acyltransferase alpha-like [Elgaria multicarinata webbii]|uniref:1-acyl-sn-glycerol-3-phosphate acyltransferase alpha-like n=1 Tax=Elgaria multicarinata webbii TaxID=159646 RepID=UPI002FCCD10B
MAHSLGLINFFLFFIAGLLLYQYSNTFRYYFKVYFLYGWIVFWSVAFLPIILIRRRTVENGRILRLVMVPLKYIYGIKLIVQGATNLDLKGPYVIVANHQGSLDWFGMFQIWPQRSTLIVKREVLYYFFVGLHCWLAGFFFINRKKKEEAIETMSTIRDVMVRDKLRVWVFPEGTRNYESSMLPFKKGAFHLAIQAQVPIVAVVMSSFQPFLNTKMKKFTTGEVTIRILPPVKTEGLSSADVTELMNRVRETMLSTYHEISKDYGKQASITKEGNCKT